MVKHLVLMTLVGIHIGITIPTFMKVYDYGVIIQDRLDNSSASLISVISVIAIFVT